MLLNIAYLDDEPELCELFEELFSSPEIAVKTYTDPQQAIQAMNQNPPDLVFLDYRLPQTTGDQVALELNDKISKFLISGDIHIETNYPFKKILKKPFNINEIESIILNTVKKY